jgi:3-dehydroquinate synthase
MTYMQPVKVELGANSYEVRIGSGLLAQAGQWLKEMGFSGRAVIITDSNVKKLYAAVLEQALAKSGFRVTILEIPPGEEQKTLKNAGRLYNELNEARAERNTPILALGGGVAGDLAGFVAATYMRGVPYLQVPTTLLAMADSSVGGKTAVDHGRLKNLVGAFYQPKLVIADIEVLKTLPAVELVNGMGEVIKHAAIRDKEFFEYLDDNMARALARDSGVLEFIVRRNAVIKAGVVGMDEKETGLRSILNYGHTVGHALEVVSNFKVKHGQAVAIGMVAEAEISRRLGILDSGSAGKLEKLIIKAGLPSRIPGLNTENLMQAMAHDKKVKQGRLTFALLKSLGEAFITSDVDAALVEEILSRG